MALIAIHVKVLTPGARAEGILAAGAGSLDMKPGGQIPGVACSPLAAT